MVEKRDAGASEGQRILHGIDLFKDRRRHRPTLPDPVGAPAAGAIPDIPFVETQHHALGRAPFCRNRVRNGDNLVDEAVHQIRARKERCGVFLVIVQIGMQRNEFRMIECVIDHRVFPMPEGRHVARGRSARRKFDRWIDPAHHLGGFLRHLSIGGRGLVLHLPGAIHFVSQTPELDVVRLLPAVRAAQIRPIGPGWMIAVFNQVSRGIAAPGAEIDRHHRLDTGCLAPVHEFIGAETVGFGAEPRKVKTGRPLIDRTDAVFPVIAGDEIAAGVTHDRRTKLLHQREYVLPKSFGIGGRMSGLVDATINASPEMLDEGAEQTRIRMTDGKIAVHQNFCFSHFLSNAVRACDAYQGVMVAAGAGVATSGNSTAARSWRE